MRDRHVLSSFLTTGRRVPAQKGPLAPRCAVLTGIAAMILSTAVCDAVGETISYVPIILDNPVPSASAKFGEPVAFIKDLDGDGIPEIAVGAEGGSGQGGGGPAGRVYIFSGRDQRLLLTIQDPDFHADNRFGSKIGSIADVDGDGAPEIIVMAPTQSGGGRAYVFSAHLATGPREICRIVGPGRFFGANLFITPDFDGDGVEDFLGANIDEQAFLYSARGCALLKSIPSPRPVTNAGFFGAAVVIGDVNAPADGFVDVALGAGSSGDLFVFSGRDWTPKYSFSGPNAGLIAMGDVNGDLVPDFAGGDPRQGQGVFVFSGRDGSLLYSLTGISFGTPGGPQPAFLAAGDLDVDGVPDLLTVDPAGVGRAVVFSGRTGAVLAQAMNPTGTAGSFGIGVSGNAFVGGVDLNGDDVPDIVVGAPAQTIGGVASVGQVFVFLSADVTPPRLVLPGNIVREATSAAGAGATYTASAADAVDGPRPVSCTPASGFTFPLGMTTVSCSASDVRGNTATGTFTVTVQDTTRPTLTLPANLLLEATAPAGSTATYTATATDLIDGSVPVSCVPASGSTFGLGITPVNCSASDTHGNVAAGSFTVTVRDTTSPVVADVTATPNPVAVNSPVTLTARADDTATAIANATYTVDGACALASCAVQTVDADGFNELHEGLTATMTFATVGVYTLCVGARDLAGNAASPECTFLPVYDPEGGFVTGGGWITSPPGAYTPNAALTGRATFGFISKYERGANVPTGQTQFQFKVADLNFHSSSYEWLVVAGARANYKGTGTINGAGVFGFMLTAIDGEQPGGGGVDRFRIKIWNKANGDSLVYDNQVFSSFCGDLTDNADPCTTLGGGSIVIHKE